MRHNARGFTLLEVLFATMILAAAMVAVTLAWSGNTLRMRKSTMMNNAATLLERKVVELQAKFQNRALNEIVNEEGDFGAEHPQYRWTFEAQELEVPDMSSAIMGSEKNPNPMVEMVVKQVQDFLSKTIKEGKVTVFVKPPGRSGGKEVAFSITTYFIDYTSAAPIPGAQGVGP